MRDFWRRFLRSLVYIRDPHGWERRYRRALALKYAPRPGVIRKGDEFWIHPALRPRIDAQIAKQNADSPFAGSALYFFGTRIRWTPLAVERAPEGGWPDVVVPKRFDPYTMRDID